MIVARIHSGLGNQLFEYATARNLAYKNRTDLLLDISEYTENSEREKKPMQLKDRIRALRVWLKARMKGYKAYETFNKREFLLDDFIIQAKIAGQTEIELAKHTYVHQEKFEYDPAILNVGDTAYLDGHWLSEKFFKDIRTLLLDEITLKNPWPRSFEDMYREMEAHESVAIHIRRGDYIQEQRINTYHGICSPEYYEKALMHIRQKHTNLRLFVFSDDIEWCKTHLCFDEPTTFVSDPKNKPTEELILMSKAKHQIIANSSFSWWGAWLNTNPNKIVVAPKKWFNVTNLDTKDVIPSSWITL